MYWFILMKNVYLSILYLTVKDFKCHCKKNRDPRVSTMWESVCRHRSREIWCEGQVVMQ
jgi:hypothetical protein